MVVEVLVGSILPQVGPLSVVSPPAVSCLHRLSLGACVKGWKELGNAHFVCG